MDGFGADPRRVEMAGGKKISDIQKDNIGARFSELGFTYTAPEKEKVEKDSTMDSEEPENLVFFYHPDHLGSTSYVTDADGNIAQHVEYIPYGEVFVEERNNSFSTNYLFNAKELDNETGLYYYGARYLDPTGAMWLSVDPMWEKYAGMSPYNYCMGNPVKLVDPDGRDVAVLTAPKGANLGGFCAGHMAILIQDKEGKWALYSKNGTNDGFGVKGKNVTKETFVEGGKRIIDIGQYTFGTIEEFLNSDHNPIEDGDREYTEAFVIKCSPEQDRLAEKGALQVLNEDYDVKSSNCAQTVQSALRNAGFDDGSSAEHTIADEHTFDLGRFGRYKLPEIKFSESMSIFPNTLYENIKKNNPNGYVYEGENK